VNSMNDKQARRYTAVEFLALEAPDWTQEYVKAILPRPKTATEIAASFKQPDDQIKVLVYLLPRKGQVSFGAFCLRSAYPEIEPEVRRALKLADSWVAGKKVRADQLLGAYMAARAIAKEAKAAARDAFTTDEYLIALGRELRATGAALVIQTIYYAGKARRSNNFTASARGAVLEVGQHMRKASIHKGIQLDHLAAMHAALGD